MALEEFRKTFGKVLMELIGTAVLLITIQMASISSPFAAVAIGLVLGVMVYCGKPISGGHFNPAVSLSIFLRGALSVKDLLLYWLFQLGGAFCGALLGALMSGQSVLPVPNPHAHVIQAYLTELVFTALLCFVVLATCTNSTTDGNSFYGAAIGLILFIGITCGGPISGGVFNPAVAISLTVLKGLAHPVYMLWIVLFQLVGGVAGAMMFYLVAPDEFGHFGEEAHRVIDHGLPLNIFR